MQTTRNRPQLLILAGITALVLLAGLVWLVSGLVQDLYPVTINGTRVPPLPALDARLVAQGKQIYVRNCAVCHGANLEGQANWKTPLADGSYPAPPHSNSGHTWHHADDQLRQIIAQGGAALYGGKMPAFGQTLSTDEIYAVVEYIKSFWGLEQRRYQWWISNTRP